MNDTVGSCAIWSSSRGLGCTYNQCVITIALITASPPPSRDFHVLGCLFWYLSNLLSNGPFRTDHNTVGRADFNDPTCTSLKIDTYFSCCRAWVENINPIVFSLDLNGRSKQTNRVGQCLHYLKSIWLGICISIGAASPWSRRIIHLVYFSISWSQLALGTSTRDRRESD